MKIETKATLLIATLVVVRAFFIYEIFDNIFFLLESVGRLSKMVAGINVENLVLFCICN